MRWRLLALVFFGVLLSARLAPFLALFLALFLAVFLALFLLDLSVSPVLPTSSVPAELLRRRFLVESAAGVVTLPRREVRDLVRRATTPALPGVATPLAPLPLPVSSPLPASSLSTSTSTSLSLPSLPTSPFSSTTPSMPLTEVCVATGSAVSVSSVDGSRLFMHDSVYCSR